MTCRLLALMLPLALIGCQGNFASRFRPASYDDAAYQVYSDLFSEKDTVGITPGQLVIIQRETIRGGNMSFDKDISRCFPQNWEFHWEYKSALADYDKQNRVPHVLDRRFNMPSSYQLLSDKQIDALISAKKVVWSGFEEKYPSSFGYIVVSAVGFNSSRTRAIVAASRDCGVLCGGGRDYAMEKIHGRWVEDHAGCSWFE